MSGAAVSNLGMIAGGGSLPLEIARSVTARGGSVHVVMIDGEADAGLRSYPHTTLNWAQLGRAVKALKRAGVKDMILVGRMARPSLKTAKFDLGFMRSLPSILSAMRAGGDDAALRGVVSLFEARGLNVVGVGDVAKELLIAEGPLGFHAPQAHDSADIATGMSLVAALGPYDIGQAVIVSGGRIEGIESAEGTDRMISRVAEARVAAGEDLASLRRGVLVKRPKPGQDVRLDLPAIGPETVDGAIRTGLAGIAGLGGQVLAASRFEMVDRADRAQLFITGAPAASPPRADRGLAIEPIVFGRLAVPQDRASDIERAVRIMGVLGEFATGSALVIAGGRVQAIGTREPPLAVLQRAKAYLNRKRRNGILVVGHREALDEALIRAASAAGIVGIVMMFGRGEGAGHKGPVLDIADRFKLFIAGAAADPKVAAL